MWQQTSAIVLRSLKYGETSVITTLFTEKMGVQTYIIKGIRKTSAKKNNIGLFQPCTLLNTVAPSQIKNIQFLKEYELAYPYMDLQQEIIKNAIALFSVELLYKLLPEHAPQEELFQFCFHYFKELDKKPRASVANYPIFFLFQCGNILGYELKGDYSENTPYLNISDGGFSSIPPQNPPYLSQEECSFFSRLYHISTWEESENFKIDAKFRYTIIDWYLAFLKVYCEHLGSIKSLSLLRTILH